MQHPLRVGKYEVEQFLGGGMSHVYRAKDTVLGRRVALKLLTDAAMADPEAKARFLQEARLASNIQHENIIAIYDFGEDNGRPFLVMEYVEGESLRKAIEANRAGTVANRIRIAAQSARALNYIHSRKVVHRDIKPENIHIDTTGKARLMDFGIANAEGAADQKQGATQGTPFYMAPEQVLGRPLTAQADIYSFGVVLYELFTGTKPFNADSVEKIFEQILYQPVDRAKLISADVPASVCDVILRCTSKKFAERPETLSPVCDALTKASESDPALPPQAEQAAEPGLLSPSSQRAPSEVRLSMPPPPSGAPTKTKAAPPPTQPINWLVVFGVAIAVLVLIFLIVRLVS
jgi:serine/threonine-protein kinase